MTEIACPLCSHRFDPATHPGCAACPLGSRCATSCCPACGYGIVDEGRSTTVRLLRGAVARVRGRGATEQGPTLAGLAVGADAEIADLDGLPRDAREQLVAYGLSPGRRVAVLQTRPVTVVRVDHLELAIEPALARGIAIAVEGGAAHA